MEAKQPPRFLLFRSINIRFTKHFDQFGAGLPVEEFLIGEVMRHPDPVTTFSRSPQVAVEGHWIDVTWDVPRVKVGEEWAQEQRVAEWAEGARTADGNR